MLSKTKTLVDDLYVIFERELFENRDLFQARKGRYVINAYNGIIMEALVLSQENEVIDGFCGHPFPCLPWKEKNFVEYLVSDKATIEKMESMLSDTDYEFFDKEYWQLENS